MELQALLFDCDGVLAETERDGHRVAYNQSMMENGIDAKWSIEEYAELVLISGGKERLRYYFKKNPEKFPAERFDDELIQKIYLKKTALFKEMINTGALPPRPGVGRIINEAHEKGVQLFVCSTSHRESVEALLSHNYGTHVVKWFTELFCGDSVARKKPAPDIYILVRDTYKLDTERCIVIEDSRNGLLAAKGAGMHCFITSSFYTKDEDFKEADAVVTCLGDSDGEKAKIIQPGRLKLPLEIISLEDINSLLK